MHAYLEIMIDELAYWTKGLNVNWVMIIVLSSSFPCVCVVLDQYSLFLHLYYSHTLLFKTCPVHASLFLEENQALTFSLKEYVTLPKRHRCWGWDAMPRPRWKLRFYFANHIIYYNVSLRSYRTENHRRTPVFVNTDFEQLWRVAKVPVKKTLNKKLFRFPVETNIMSLIKSLWFCLQ